MGLSRARRAANDIAPPTHIQYVARNMQRDIAQ